MKDKTNLQKLLDFIYDIDYALTPSERMIVQKERNELKYNLLEGIIEALIQQGMPSDLIHRTSDGYIFELQNAELGVIPIQIDIKVKDVDFDLEGSIEDWEQKVEEKRSKEKQKQEIENRKAAKRAAKAKKEDN
jgi:hypothetical protein